jgi:hypothetical protein
MASDRGVTVEASAPGFMETPEFPKPGLAAPAAGHVSEREVAPEVAVPAAEVFEPEVAPEFTAPAAEVFEPEVPPEFATPAAEVFEPEVAPGLAAPVAAVPPELAAVIEMVDAAAAADRAAAAAERPGLAFGPPGAQDAADVEAADAASEPAHAGPGPDAPEPVLAAASSGAGVPGGHETPAATACRDPVVLEDDSEVRERLRFLIWMRRLRAKKRGEVAHVG